MSNLVDHARAELERAGYFDPDSDYGGMIGDAVLKLVEVFAEQGHSGNSVATVLPLVTALMAFDPLTELTDDPGEWQQVEMGDQDCWQSRRWPEAFSSDGGKRYYGVGDPDQITRPTQPAG